MPDCPAVIGNKITATIGVGRSAAVDNALVGFNKVLAVNSTASGVIGGDANYAKANVAVIQSVLESINGSPKRYLGSMRTQHHDSEKHHYPACNRCW